MNSRNGNTYRRPYRRRNYTNTNGNKTVKKVARKEAKKVFDRNVETKHWDGFIVVVTALVPDVPVPVPASGNNYYITSSYPGGPSPSPPDNMQRGLDENDYIGGMVDPVYLMLYYIVQYPPSADGVNAISLTLFQAKGAFTAIYNDTENQISLAGDTLAPIGMVNTDYNDRLTILKRHVITLDGIGQTQKFGVMRIKAKKMRRIHFNSDGTIEANPIFLSVVSDSTAAEHPAIRASWRLSYKDA